MALTKEERELLQGIREDQIVLNTVLLGVDGKEGLVDSVRDLARGYGKLKRNFFLLCGILIGSGVLSSGAWAILNFR